MAGLRIIIIIFLLSTASYADIGLICTLKGEKEEILKYLKVEEKVFKAEREFYKGILDGKRVVLVRSPMGKVNNAITAQIMASHFQVDTIISIGFGGAVDRSLKIGDIVVATEAVQHDFGTLKPYGFIWERSPYIGEQKEVNLKEWTQSKGYFYGTIVSGDQFIASKDKREWLKKKFNALAVDMGAAAIHEVCKQNRIQCLFIRVISDKADIEGRIGFNDSAQSGNYKTVSVLKEFLTNYQSPEGE